MSTLSPNGEIENEYKPKPRNRRGLGRDPDKHKIANRKWYKVNKEAKQAYARGDYATTAEYYSNNPDL